MRKQLLTVFGLGIAVASFATNPIYNKVQKVDRTLKSKMKLDNSPVSFTEYNLAPNATPNQFVTSQASNVSRVAIGSSPNLYTSIYSMMNKVYANQDLNLITLTRRRNAGDPGNVGYTQVSYSTDGGNTFDTTLALVSDDNKECRYPSGAIYNPPGNTNPGNAFVVGSGPWHPGELWQGNFFASRRINGSDWNVTFTDNNVDPQKSDFARTNIQSCTNGKVYVTSTEYLNVNGTTAAEQGFQKGVLNIGTFDEANNLFNWDTRTFPHNFKLDIVENLPRVFSTAHTAWSEDGQVGYFIYIGEDATTSFDYYMPIVYKTNDAGATWSLMPLYDFRNLPNLMQYIRETNVGTKRPFFTMEHGFDAVVDKNNNLHLLTAVSSCSSDNPDSIDYTWAIPRNVFDVFVTPCGNWNAIFVDSLQTGAVDAADSPWSADGGVGWDARLQMGRTQDGSKIFYTWMDTELETWGNLESNLFPDIIGRGFDIDSKNLTARTNFTEDDLATSGRNFWLFSSNIDLVKNDTVFVVPTTIADSREQGNDGLGPITHFYLKGVEFTASQFNIPAFTCQPLSLTVTAQDDTCSSGVGSATLNLQNPSQYCIQLDGQLITNTTATGIEAGNHIFIVTDNSGCSYSASFEINDQTGFESAALTSTQSTTCSAADGSATINVLPADNVTYLWNTNPPQTTATANNLVTGFYEVSITTAIGCTYTYETFVGSVVSLQTSGSTVEPSCFGGSNGTATITVENGTAPFSYQWNTTPAQSTQSATGLSAGSYTVVVTDSEGCITIDTVTVGQPQILAISSSTISAQNSTSQPDGSISVTVAGGTNPYTYSWNTTPPQNTNSASGLIAGTYTVTITDANGCTVQSNFDIPNFTSILKLFNDSELSLFPNPSANGVFYIKTEGMSSNTTVNVFDLTGKKLTTSGVNNGTSNNIYTLDLSNQPNGVYMVQIISNNQTITKRIVKSAK